MGGFAKGHLRQHATSLVYYLELTGDRILEVHSRVPVGRHILGDTARSAISSHERRGIGRHPDT